MKYRVPITGEWVQFSDASLATLRAHGKGGLADGLMEHYREYLKNPMARFLPHGVAWRDEPKVYADGAVTIPAADYPKEWRNDGVAFMNDWKRDYVMMLASRKTGKSASGAVKVGNFMLNCDPAWPCYSGEGGWLVQHRAWNGPQTAIVSSFGTQNLAELWAAYLEFWPRDELGPYAPEYPREDLGEGVDGSTDNPPIWGRARHMAFGDGRPKDFVPFKSGGRIIFLLYTQMQHVWMNFKANIWHADEQPQIARLHAFESGTQTMGDYTPIIFTFSGFKLPDRPDTGAAGPLKRIWDLRDTMGKKPSEIGRYNIDIPSVPDAIITAKKKKQQYDKYANPEIERDIATERLGLAVYFPGWEPGGGLAFGPDVWQRELCVIAPLWEEGKTPRNWTKWRVIDFCDNKTTCVSWFGIGPWKTWWGEVVTVRVLYRLLYERKMLVAGAAERVIAMSHNSSSFQYEEHDDQTHNTYQYFMEVQNGEQFYGDLIDSRIGAQKQQGQMIIDMFRRYGLTNLAPASGKDNQDQIGSLKDIMRIDYDKPHPFRKNEKDLAGGGDGKVMGCPGLFVFDGVCDGAVDELDNLAEDSSLSGKHVIDMNQPHDFVDTAKYWASENPQYMGDYGLVGGETDDDLETGNSYWGRL